MEQKFYILKKNGFLSSVSVNNQPEGAEEVAEELFHAANTAMGKCPPDQRVAVSDDFAFSYVPFEYAAEDQRLIEINTAKQYLAATDWYYARKAETGDEVPADVVQKRIDAREFLRANAAPV